MCFQLARAALCAAPAAPARSGVRNTLDGRRGRKRSRQLGSNSIQLVVWAASVPARATAVTWVFLRERSAGGRKKDARPWEAHKCLRTCEKLRFGSVGKDAARSESIWDSYIFALPSISKLYGKRCHLSATNPELENVRLDIRSRP